MNSRRTFFRSLAQAAALIALAPQLAFRVRSEVPVATIDPEMQRAFVEMFFFGKTTKDLVCQDHGFTATHYAWPTCSVYEEAVLASDELKKLYGV